MASPMNMSPWPGVAEPLPLPGPDIVVSQPLYISDPDVVLIRLREQIAGGGQEMDTLLGTIAIAAQAMTDATGAALGILRDGSVACVGRSGETAPALGARLSGNSGISGECLRNGRSQRCDDTETDPRVDAEVCRHLGLRSIAAVPIRSRLETVGILEVFSTTAHAFSEEHMARLVSLAELADAASSAAVTNTYIQPAGRVDQGLEPRPDLPVLSSSWTQSEKSRKAIFRYLAVAGAVVVLGLFSVASWKMWSELKSRNAPKPVVAQSTETTPIPTDIPASTEHTLPAKPTPERLGTVQTPANTTQKNSVVQAARTETEPDDGLIRSIPTDSSAKINKAVGMNKPAAIDASVNTPPQVAIVSTPDDSLNGILTSHAAMPKLSSAHISEGVTPLLLQHKVMPSYPHQAMVIRREGTVVLRAIVSDTGQVSDIKLMSGDLILGRAAIDAVRQWRYHPALLNGKPTQTETDITLNFKLSQIN